MKTQTIALAAGGSGGHFFPAEALARELTSRGHRVVIYTDNRGEKYAGKLHDVELVTLPATPVLPGLKGKLETVKIILKAAWQARRHMQRRRAVCLVAFGGYPSFAPALGCWSLRRPLIIHEQATKVSLANSKLLPIASKLAISFRMISGAESLPHDKVIETGNPVRSAIIASRMQPYMAPNATDPIRILVVGGSQSASIFGEVVPPALLLLPDQLRRRIRLSLQYNGADAEAITARLEAAGITASVAPFFTDMAERLAKTQLVICRAGASTAAELLVVGRPAIFVPIPKGGSMDEQRRNAEAFEKAGTGWYVPQEWLTPDSLAQRLNQLLQNPERLSAAAAAAHALGQPHAAIRLADLVEQTL